MDEMCQSNAKLSEIGSIGGIGCEAPIKERCFVLRDTMEGLKHRTKSLLQHGVFSIRQSTPDQHSEMKANIMLAYRHLEDARMRLGKVVQAYDGGKSVYPR